MLESILGGLIGPVKDIALALLGPVKDIALVWLGRDMLESLLTVWYWPALALGGLVLLSIATWAHRSDTVNFSLKSLQGLVVSVVGGAAVLTGLTVTVITAVRGVPASQNYPAQHYSAPASGVKHSSTTRPPENSDPFPAPTGGL